MCGLLAISLSAQEPASQSQCWYNDPNDPDNMILAPCNKVSVATGESKAGDSKSAQTTSNSQAANSNSQLTTQQSTGSSPLVASDWCVAQSRNSQPTASSNSSDHNSSRTPGCDVGLGVSLFTHNRLSLVSVLGTKTLGIGLALIVVKPTPSFPRVVALALGVVARYDSSGIYREVYPALGATLSFRGASQ